MWKKEEPPLLLDCETIVSVLARRVKEKSDHQVFRWVDKKGNVSNSLSYKELWDNSVAVAHLLESKDVQKGDRVMIAYPFGLEFLAGLVGCMMTGVIGCSVYPPNPQQLKIDLPAFNLKVQDAGAKFALTTSSFKRFMSLNNFVGHTTEVTWLATDKLRDPSNNWRPRMTPEDVSPDDIAFIQYTSGSTGFPKGVMISQRSLVFNAHLCSMCCNALSVSNPTERSNHIVVSWMPQYHDMGLIGFFFMTMYSGISGIAFSPFDFILNPILWHDVIVKYRARTTCGPNFSFGLLVKRLLSRKQAFVKWTFVDSIVCAAEPVDPAVMDQVVHVLGAQPSSIRVGYGLAEVGLAVCFSSYSVHDGLVACGDLDGDSNVCIVDEACRKVEDCTIGEVFVHSPRQVALGYWGNPAVTLATFSAQVENVEGDWLATGDLGKVIDNTVYITGRKKELIIVNGRNFFPVDIERAVEKAWPLVIRPGCVVAYQHSNTSIGLVADLRKGVKDENRPTAFEVSGLISRECQVPTDYVCLLKTHGIPKTTSGKVKRTQVKNTSIAGTWPQNMIELEWRKLSNVGVARNGMRRQSHLEMRFSLLGVTSSSNFVTAEMLAEVSRKSLSIEADDIGSIVEVETAEVIKTDDNAVWLKGSSTRSGMCPFAMNASVARTGGLYGSQGMSIFYGQHGTGPYQNGPVVEDATLDYGGVVEELKLMEHRLESGKIKRQYEIAENVFVDTQFWTAVPGFPPKQFGLAQDAEVHKAYLPWLRSVFAGLPSQDSHQRELRKCILEKGESFSAEDTKEWINETMWRSFASKSLSPVELKEFSQLQSDFLRLVSGQASTSHKDYLLKQKANYLRELMERLQIDDDKASALFDVLVFAATLLARTVHICVAVLFGGNQHFDAIEDQVDESNVMQFVWECLRLYPPQAAVGWRESDNTRHVAVVGMTGRDKSVWGEDVDCFRHDRCTADEFSAKSCFFAEQAGNYACRGKTFVLEVTSAVLLEIVASGPWKCPTEIRSYPAMPYFDQVELKRLPRVVVVGGGVSGLICALRLSQRGIKVTVVEKNATIGGHARHAEAFGDHRRNPAFGAFVQSIYPNLMHLVDVLGLEKVEICRSADFRQNIALDGHDIQEADPREIARFLAQMRSAYKSNSFGESQSIGEFLKRNGYDYEFICGFIVGKAVHYFAGLTIGQYLDIPLELFAWFLVSEMEKDGVDAVYRLRNKDYMDAFTSTLVAHGVEILTGIAPELLSRDASGILISLGSSKTISADKMVLAVPPNAAAEFLGEHILPSEMMLSEFDCPLETVVLHQDPKWTPKNHSCLCGVLPNAGEPLPSLADTIPMTTALVSDTDHKTLIYSTHSYANYRDLVIDIDGPKEYMSFTHVRITHQTVLRRNSLLASQGKNNTYFAGGWLRGFMLHEDALVSGMEVANAILSPCGLEVHSILKRNIELPSEKKRQLLVKPPPTGMQVAVLQLISSELGREVHLTDRLQDLGFTSLLISSLHGSLQEMFGLTDDELPVSVFFEGETTIGDLTAKVLRNQTSCTPETQNKTGYTGGASQDTYVNVGNEILKIISDEVGRDVELDNLLEELGLTSLVISSLHSSLQERFALTEDEFPVSILLDGKKTIGDIVAKVRGLSHASRNEDSNALVGQEYLKRTDVQPTRRPHVQPVLDACLGNFLQMIAIAAQAVFFATSVFVPIVCSLVLLETLGGWKALVLLPLLTHVHAIASAVLLILVKWALVGRQKAGYTALWSGRFAARWIVRQCAQLVWSFSLWSLCGELEIMNILHRLLGCKVGKGASIEPGCMTDFDLVEIGSRTSIASGAIINTAHVSLGVQTLRPIVIGSDCTMKADCLIERGSTIHDEVILQIRSLVSPFSTLSKGSCWHGKPAEQMVANDIETGCSSRPEHLSLSSASSRCWGGLSIFDASRFCTVFVLAPYLWLSEFGLALFVGSQIYQSIGWLGLGGLIWVPPTVVWAIAFAVSISMKKLLLGCVKPGVWPVGGSFHARKYVVDHLVEEHALRWKTYSTNLGSYIAGSLLIERQLLRWLGVEIGTSTQLWSKRQWTSYDLLSVGSRVVVGGNTDFFVWRTTHDNLIGESVLVSDDCFVGATAVLLGGVELGKGGAVASYSIADDNVGAGQTVVGTKSYQNAIVEGSGEDWSMSVREVGIAVGLFAVWVGISVFVGLLLYILESTAAKVEGSKMSILELAGVTSCLVGFVLIVAFPLYLVLMMWVGKITIIGRFTPTEISNSSYQISPRFAFGPAFLSQFVPYTTQAFGGTWLEQFFWAALGAKIGDHVYIDRILMYEPDLVSIGDWTSLTGTALTCHHGSSRTHRYSPTAIGKRCTAGLRCNVQLASLEDDTEMIGFTMPLTGARLKGGTWVGYPASRVGNVSQPPRPPRSALITLLCHPWSTILGCIWLLTLPLQNCFVLLRRQQTERSSETVTNIPEELRGTFASDDCLLELNFNSAEWKEVLRILRIPAGNFMISVEEEKKKLDRWWTLTSYEFDLSNDKEYTGRVFLGWWSVPMSIVTAKLRCNGTDLLWSHSWFNGDPDDEICFRRKGNA